MTKWLRNYKYTVTVIFFLCGLFIGVNLDSFPLKSKNQDAKSIEKLITLLTYIDQDYVENIDMDSLVNKIIIDVDKEIKRDSISN